MPYISLDDFLLWPGADTSSYTDTTEEGPLQVVLETASAFVDALSDTPSWDYRVVTGEEHLWLPQLNGTWEVIQRFSPLRTVTDLSLVFWYDWDYNDVLTPVPVNSYRTDDNAIESRWRPWPGRDTTLVPLLGYWGRIDPPVVRVSYTAGYDDGTTQSDGLSVPYPSWLREATRLMARALIEQDALSRMGMANLEAIRVGQVEARRAANSVDFKIPQVVMTLLARPPIRDDEIVLR